jgi:hypothetical protein
MRNRIAEMIADSANIPIWRAFVPELFNARELIHVGSAEQVRLATEGLCLTSFVAKCFLS